MNVLYIASSGSSDPTRASIPFHLAVNGSIERGHEVGVVLAGDSTEFLKPELLVPVVKVPGFTVEPTTFTPTPSPAAPSPGPRQSPGRPARSRPE